MSAILLRLQNSIFFVTWQGNAYQFTCLPNGIPEVSRILTKLMKPVFAAIRVRCFAITSFIDDTLIRSSFLPGCLTIIKDTIVAMRQLGFSTRINEEKFVLVSTKWIEHLGNIIDTEAMNISLTARRVDTILTIAGGSCKSTEKLR